MRLVPPSYTRIVTLGSEVPWTVGVDVITTSESTGEVINGALAANAEEEHAVEKTTVRKNGRPNLTPAPCKKDFRKHAIRNNDL